MDKVKITDEILFKNNFQLGEIVKEHQYFCISSDLKNMDIYKTKDGEYFHSVGGFDYPVVFLSQINEFYKKRTGHDLLY